MASNTLLATQRLLEGGFLITWLDRYPAQIAKPAPALPSGASQASAYRQIPGIPPAAFVPPVQTGAATVIQAPKAINRSNRSKYVCPGCGLAAWGKPGLRIACMSCDNTPLDESGITDE